MHKRFLATCLAAILCSCCPAKAQPSLAISSITVYSTTSYEWSVNKTSSASTISIQLGNSGTAEYTVDYLQSAGPATYTVQGLVTVTNPYTTQLQLSGIEVQAQYPNGSSNGPIAATVTCPGSQTLDGVLLVNAALADSAASTLVCNYTAQLPSSDQGLVVAQANSNTGAAPLISQPKPFAIDPDDPTMPTMTVGQCAQVNDTFDPLSYEGLGAPQIIRGTQPPGDSQNPDLICATKKYTYTVQFTAASQAACGSFIVSNTAVVVPIGDTQGAQSTVVYLEVDACNAPEVAVPPDVGDSAVSDSSPPQVTLSITSQTGGGTSYSWGVSNSALTQDIQLPANSTTQVSYGTAFTRSISSQAAAVTVSGALVISNPTNEDMVLAEVEVSYVSADTSQQVDTPASCQTSVGGDVLVGAQDSVTCLFTATYTSQQAGSFWASAVTADGFTGRSDQVPVDPTNPGSITSVASCATVSVGFATGSPGLVAPSSFTAEGEMPPTSSDPQQICSSQTYTYTAVFGPFINCGKMLATSTAAVNPVGGQQSTETADMSVNITVLC